MIDLPYSFTIELPTLEIPGTPICLDGLKADVTWLGEYDGYDIEAITYPDRESVIHAITGKPVWRTIWPVIDETTPWGALIHGEYQKWADSPDGMQRLYERQYEAA